MNYEGLAASLLTLGEAGWSDDWQAKYQPLGFSLEHVPNLIRMAVDDELNQADTENAAIWAPVHAWRILGILRAEEAVRPLIEQLGRDDENDWAAEEIPKALAMIGEPALRPLTWQLADLKRDIYARAGAADALAKMPAHHPELRQECVSRLERELAARCRENDETLNGFLVAHLSDLKAVETIATIRQAYQDGCVDLTICGDIEDVEIDFGLREQRSKPRPRLMPHGLFAKRKRTRGKIGRNDLCPCNSGKKYKKCCWGK
jgi:hypothetical protein